MRNIEKIFVHCTGSQCGTSVQSILGVFKAMGWKNPGYHYLVDAEGTVHRLLGLDKVANGVRGHNATSVHVAYIGGSRPPERQPTRVRRRSATRSAGCWPICGGVIRMPPSWGTATFRPTLTETGR